MMHDQKHFYKYVTMETALKVVETMSFRWSSPIHFNDPFDNQTGFKPSFTPEDLSAAVKKLFYDILIHKINFNPTFQTELSQTISILQKLPVSDKSHLLLKEIDPVFTEMASSLNTALIRLNQDIIKNHCHSRVFCVSETNTSPAMWAHYADNHTGIVFKLACIEEIDNPLNVARKVNYSNSFPEFPTLADYMKDLTGELKLDIEELAQELAYWKHTDWQYEQEWRVIYPMLNDPHGDGHKFIKENPRVFEAAFIGCKADPQKLETLKALSRRALPNMRFFKTTPSAKSFSFEFLPDYS